MVTITAEIVHLRTLQIGNEDGPASPHWCLKHLIQILMNGQCTYVEWIDQCFCANAIPAGEKLFLTVNRNISYALLRNVLAAGMPTTKKYTELVAALKSHLDPKPLVIAEHFKFHHRNQRIGGTIAQYLAKKF